MTLPNRKARVSLRRSSHLNLSQSSHLNLSHYQGMDGGDWKACLPPYARHRIVHKIMGTLKRHLPFSGSEGLRELRNIAERFEEKIYSAAISQSDYRRKISLKMLTMETRS